MLRIAWFCRMMTNMQTDPDAFDHFIITRFNVRVRETAASDEWLRHRLQYFEGVSCASIRSQTSTNFRWIVLFDSVREPWFEAEITRLADGLFEAVWVEGPFTPTLAPALVAERSTAPWLITSRVDNDDALARDYVELVQAQFHKQDAEFLNFQSGLQLTDAGALFHRLDPSNAFISLIEKRTGQTPMGVYVSSHDVVANHAPLRQLQAHPMWLQMVHDRNIGNQARGVRANPDLLARYFDIDRAPAPVSRPALAADRVKSASTLAWRVVQKPSRIAWLGKLIRNRVRMAIER